MAKDEQTEKEHFNTLLQDCDLDSVAFSPELTAHQDHALIEAGISMLGDLRGKKILLLGCGSGKEAWHFVTCGAEVVGMDISYNYVRIAEYGSKKHTYNDHTRFLCMSCYSTGFKDSSFDVVIGHAILHHLDREKVGAEISRILKKGGSALFTEPLDSNPILGFTRDYLPYPGKHRLKGEKALSYKDIKCIAQSFSECQCREMQFLSMLVRIFPNEKVYRFLEAVDTALLRLIPIVKYFCRVIVVKLVN